MTEIPDKEPLLDLIEEVADWIRQSRGPSHYEGDYAIDQSVRHHFRERLINALVADIPDEPLTENDIQCFEVGRKAYRRERQALDLRDEGLARAAGLTLEEWRKGD